MISIQELGLSILGQEPKKLYILGGTEYGIKDKYIDHLTQFYGGLKYEYPQVSNVIDTMSVRHLVPLKPALYVVRYDESFVSSINEQLASKLKACKIIGTLVCIYSDSKHIAKIDKFLPEYTGQVDAVNPKFIEKYLMDFKPDVVHIQVSDPIGLSVVSYAHKNNIPIVTTEHGIFAPFRASMLFTI